MNFCKTSPRFSLPLSKLTGRHTLHATHVRERGGTKSRGIGEGGGGKVENFFSFSLSGLSLASFFSTLSGALCPPPSPPKSYFFPLFFFPGNAFFSSTRVAGVLQEQFTACSSQLPQERREGGRRESGRQSNFQKFYCSSIKHGPHRQLVALRRRKKVSFLPPSLFEALSHIGNSNEFFSPLPGEGPRGGGS